MDDSYTNEIDTSKSEVSSILYDDSHMYKNATDQESVQVDSLGPIPAIHERMLENRRKLKASFESIFEKYSKDFEGVADEVDIFSGEIIVDNGFIRNSGTHHFGNSDLFKTYRVPKRANDIKSWINKPNKTFRLNPFKKGFKSAKIPKVPKDEFLSFLKPKKLSNINVIKPIIYNEENVKNTSINSTDSNNKGSFTSNNALTQQNSFIDGSFNTSRSNDPTVPTLNLESMNDIKNSKSTASNCIENSVSLNEMQSSLKTSCPDSSNDQILKDVISMSSETESPIFEIDHSISFVSKISKEDESFSDEINDIIGNGFQTNNKSIEIVKDRIKGNYIQLYKQDFSSNFNNKSDQAQKRYANLKAQKINIPLDYEDAEEVKGFKEDRTLNFSNSNISDDTDKMIDVSKQVNLEIKEDICKITEEEQSVDKIINKHPKKFALDLHSKSDDKSHDHYYPNSEYFKDLYVPDTRPELFANFVAEPDPELDALFYNSDPEPIEVDKADDELTDNELEKRKLIKGMVEDESKSSPKKVTLSLCEDLRLIPRDENGKVPGYEFKFEDEEDNLIMERFEKVVLAGGDYEEIIALSRQIAKEKQETLESKEQPSEKAEIKIELSSDSKDFIKLSK